MRRHVARWITSAVVLAAGTGVVSALPASGSTGAPVRPASKPAGAHIEIFDIERGYAQQIDVGAPGLSAGDVIVENHKEVDVQTGKAVATAVTTVQLVRVFHSGDGIGMIQCTIIFRHGQIHFAGAVRLADVFGDGAVVPVVGGTGQYDSVGGQVFMQFGQLNGKDGTYLTFDLTP